MTSTTPPTPPVKPDDKATGFIATFLNDKTIFLKDWAPALITSLITGIIGGLVIAVAVPWANSYFEKKRLFQERQTRLLESTSDVFASVIEHFGKIRALPEAISQAKKKRDSLKDAPDKKAELDEYIKKRTTEMRETEVSLYKLWPKLQANLVLIKLFFGEETNGVIDEFSKWYDAQGDKPIQATDLKVHSRKLLGAMVKEMGK